MKIVFNDEVRREAKDIWDKRLVSEDELIFSPYKRPDWKVLFDYLETAANEQLEVKNDVKPEKTDDTINKEKTTAKVVFGEAVENAIFEYWRSVDDVKSGVHTTVNILEHIANSQIESVLLEAKKPVFEIGKRYRTPYGSIAGPLREPTAPDSIAKGYVLEGHVRDIKGNCVGYWRWLEEGRMYPRVYECHDLLPGAIDDTPERRSEIAKNAALARWKSNVA